MEFKQAIKMYLDVNAMQDAAFKEKYSNPRINGKRIETIEVNLNDYSLVQSRGLCNKSTKYHKRIVKLVEANMDEIIKRNTHLKKAV